MSDQFGDKTHEATQHRREQAREEGNVARSHDLSSAALLVAGIAALLYLGRDLAEYFGRFSMHQLGTAPQLDSSVEAFVGIGQQVVVDLGTYILPFLGLLLLASVGSQVGQFGFLFVPQKLSFDWSRIDPIKGWERLVSLSNVVRLGFSIFKLLVITSVAAWTLWGRWDSILTLPERDVMQVGLFLIEITLWTALKIAMALFILSLLDYGFQRWKYEQDLRMSTQELREEFRSLQGDPQIISRRKALQRHLALNRIKTAVPDSDVVVTNPTELAIALKYDLETMEAPLVVAKGAGLVAQRIRRIALENGVPVVERKELAQVLYKSVEIGKPIPPEQYTAMAEVLRYVYQLKGKTIPNVRRA